MDWLIDLILGNDIAHAIFVYSLVIALGVILGKIKLLGISLGTTFVLFVGIVVGHLGLTPDISLIKFIQQFGLILFLFSIGLQVGPSFFSSFKQGGLLLNGLAALIIVLNIAVALAIFFADGSIKFNEIVGVLSGAVTNTPGLGAAQQTVIDTQGSAALSLNEAMSMGYAAAYPLGVIGIILTMILVKVFFKINVDKESQAIEQDKDDSHLHPHNVTYVVTNKLIFDHTLQQLHRIIDRDFVVSRMQKKGDGEVIIPKSETKIEEGDKMLIVMSMQDEEVFDVMIGSQIDDKLEDDAECPETQQVVSRRILITKSELSGKKLGSLRLRSAYHLNATHVNRAGVDLLASPNLSLQVGDRVTVVGHLGDIEHLAEKMGNSMKRLNQPNMFTIFFGIMLGIIVGAVPIAIPGMAVPMKLGLAGGPLIVAILLGRYGYKLKIVTYTSSSANLLLRELGICLFLASVGVAAGEKFFSTVFTSQGATWVFYGFLITLIPLLVVGFLARGKFKINYCSIMGLLSGSTTDPPALAYANKVANNDAPAVAYSTVYPLTTFLRVVAAQILVLALV